MLMHTMKKFNMKEKEAGIHENEKTVILNAESSTYADLPKKEKDIANTQIHGLNVKCVRKSNKGDLVIIMTNNSVKPDKLM